MRDGGYVITVNGETAPDQLGVTLTHEHIFVDGTKYYEAPDDPVAATELSGPVRSEMRGYLQYYDFWNRDNLLLDDISTAMEELKRFQLRGGGTVCDVSSRGIRIDRLLPQLVRIGGELKINIIVGTGCYIERHHEQFVGEASIEELAILFAGEVLEGIGGSGIRAGIIGEIGLSTPPTPSEWRVLRAAAIAHRNTGAPIIIHQSDGRDYRIPHLALDLLEEESVALDRVVIGHSNFNPGLAPVEHAIRRGAYVAFDHFGMLGYERGINWQLPQELEYVNQVMALIRAGHIDRLLISQDICVKTHLRKYGGHGYAHLLGLVRTMFQRAGLSEDEFRVMMENNAASLLAVGR